MEASKSEAHFTLCNLLDRTTHANNNTSFLCLSSTECLGCTKDGTTYKTLLDSASDSSTQAHFLGVAGKESDARVNVLHVASWDYKRMAAMKAFGTLWVCGSACSLLTASMATLCIQSGQSIGTPVSVVTTTKAVTPFTSVSTTRARDPSIECFPVYVTDCNLR